MQTKTKKSYQRSIAMLQFIQQFHSRTAFSPTLREIGDAVGLSSISSVHQYLVNLREGGYVMFFDEQPRTITLTESAVQLLKTLEEN